jgi:ribonuclease BN (tRNA processing enzyme)
MTIRLKDYNELPQLDSDEIEISTIGVGTQEGESVVVHLGEGKWAIIDSCKTSDGIVLPLHYLSSIGVKAENVEKVLCTHWHRDHIKGLKDVVSKCENAEFYFPIIGQNNNYLKFLYRGDVAQNNSSVWHEFIGCIKNAGKKTAFSGTDRLVFDSNNGIQLFALSPSDKMVEKMLKIVAKFDDKDADYRKINDSAIKPNMGSSAFLLVTPEANVLLGADLEANRNYKKPVDSCIGSCSARYDKGWCNVIDRGVTLRGKRVSLFKLPHHSSRTGYCDAIWTNHITEDIISVSTVFINNKGVKLPQKDMLEKYHSQSKSMYMTSLGPRRKDRNNANGKSMLETVNVPEIQSIAVLKEEQGIVCCRKKMGQPWQTYLLGSAIEVDDAFVKQYQV